MREQTTTRAMGGLRFAHSIGISLATAAVLMLLGYGISRLEETGQAAGNDGVLYLLMLPVGITVGAATGLVFRAGRRLLGLMEGAAVGLLLVGGYMAVAMLVTTNSAGEPFAGALLAIAGAATAASLLMELTGIAIRLLPRQSTTEQASIAAN